MCWSSAWFSSGLQQFFSQQAIHGRQVVTRADTTEVNVNVLFLDEFSSFCNFVARNHRNSCCFSQFSEWCFNSIQERLPVLEFAEDEFWFFGIISGKFLYSSFVSHFLWPWTVWLVTCSCVARLWGHRMEGDKSLGISNVPVWLRIGLVTRWRSLIAFGSGGLMLR